MAYTTYFTVPLSLLLGAEVVHLKQRLSESRQSCVRLEIQVASLKTEVAKLQGSLQAMVAIRDHLSEEGQQLQHCNRYSVCVCV